MHDPVPGKRHLNKSANILLAPVIDQPDCTLVCTDNSKRTKFFPSFIHNPELKITISQASYYLFRTFLYISNIRIQFIYIQLFCKIRYLFLEELEPEGTRIEVAYKVAESEDDDEDFDDEDNTYYLSGTLEKGFDEFTVNDIPLIPGFNLLPYTLSDGEKISYNHLLGAYSSEVYFLDDTVDVYWEPNEEMTDANKAFELFEKVNEKTEIFDKLARNRIRAELQVKIADLRKEYEDPEMEVDDLMDDLLLTIMVYDCIGTFEFAYETWEPDLRISTRGFYNMPFTTVMIEDISEEDN